MIDGFRYGFFGLSDTSPWLSLAIVGGFLAGLTALTLSLLSRGWRLRS
jgi:ABC-2 type transport system permease protein